MVTSMLVTDVGDERRPQVGILNTNLTHINVADFKKGLNFHINLKTVLIYRQFSLEQYIDWCATFHFRPNINLEQSFHRLVCSPTIFHTGKQLLCLSQYQ